MIQCQTRMWLIKVVSTYTPKSSLKDNPLYKDPLSITPTFALSHERLCYTGLTVFIVTGYLCRVAMPISKKKFYLGKNGGHFEFFAKIAKHKNAYISKTLLDRAISTKFLTHRVSLLSSHASFQKKNFSPKMAAILNFRIFRKIAKHKNAYISKTVLDRAISMKFLTHRVSLQSSQAIFKKNLSCQKWRPF